MSLVLKTDIVETEKGKKMLKDCNSCKYDDFWLDEHCEDCHCGKGSSSQPTHWEPADYYEPDTNADVIRRMTDEELAKWIVNNAVHPEFVCIYCEHNNKEKPCIDVCLNTGCMNKTDEEIVLEWLRKPAEG